MRTRLTKWPRCIVQTFGDLANFNPHVHVLAADGAFGAHGTFVPLPAVPEGLLREGFRRAVLGFLAGKGAVSEDLGRKLLGWRYSGFSVHNQDAPGSEAELPGDARCPVAAAALSPHSGSLRAPGALRRLVLEPRARRTGQSRERAQRTGPGRGERRTGERICRARQGRLGAAHPQGL